MRFSLFFESKAKEQAINQAKNILIYNSIDNPEEVIQWIRTDVLHSAHPKYVPLVAFFYEAGIDKQFIKDVFENFLRIKDKVSVDVGRTRVLVQKKGNNQTVEFERGQLLEFSEFVDGILSAQFYAEKARLLKNQEVAGEHVGRGDNIDVYMPKNALDAAILGKGTPFCISRFGTPYFSQYRYGHKFTIYFIFDKNRSGNDPLRIVVYMVSPEGKALLTDCKNTTGTIDHPYRPGERGKYVQEYQKYLKEHGIDVGKDLAYRPLTDKEKDIIKRFNRRLSLQQLKKITIEEFVDYMGINGSVGMDELRYILDQAIQGNEKMKKLLEIYFHTGKPLGKDLFNKLLFLEKSLLRKYFYHRILANNHPMGRAINSYELAQMDKKEKDKLDFREETLSSLVNDENGPLLYDYIIKYKKKDKIVNSKYLISGLCFLLSSRSNISFDKKKELLDVIDYMKRIVFQCGDRDIIKYYVDNKIRGREEISIDDAHGLINHFSREEIIEMIREKLSIILDCENFVELGKYVGVPFLLNGLINNQPWISWSSDGCNTENFFNVLKAVFRYGRREYMDFLLSRIVKDLGTDVISDVFIEFLSYSVTGAQGDRLKELFELYFYLVRWAIDNRAIGSASFMYDYGLGNMYLALERLPKHFAEELIRLHVEIGLKYPEHARVHQTIFYYILLFVPHYISLLSPYFDKIHIDEYELVNAVSSLLAGGHKETVLQLKPLINKRVIHLAKDRIFRSSNVDENKREEMLQFLDSLEKTVG